jgi:hypothetical protein
MLAAHAGKASKIAAGASKYCWAGLWLEVVDVELVTRRRAGRHARGPQQRRRAPGIGLIEWQGGSNRQGSLEVVVVVMVTNLTASKKGAT